MQICLKSQVASCWQEKCLNLFKNKVDSISFRVERSQPPRVLRSLHRNSLGGLVFYCSCLGGETGDTIAWRLGRKEAVGTTDSIRNAGARENQDQTSYLGLQGLFDLSIPLKGKAGKCLD